MDQNWKTKRSKGRLWASEHILKPLEGHLVFDRTPCAPFPGPPARLGRCRRRRPGGLLQDVEDGEAQHLLQAGALLTAAARTCGEAQQGMSWNDPEINHPLWFPLRGPLGSFLQRKRNTPRSSRFERLECTHFFADYFSRGTLP